ncbi:hypothetical protein B0T21DRAFT_356036 [Apiosordaria backusii]|uniref:Uncharacterized protein n=1 Tax=Apiosordaria backusii TaxID=314023 RepID=A0AA40EZH9_9PEZI|nr:hypothetical protein B0T21DRAFT_356036 [Apiosordaria backusii]
MTQPSAVFHQMLCPLSTNTKSIPHPGRPSRPGQNTAVVAFFSHGSIRPVPSEPFSIPVSPFTSPFNAYR